MELLVNSNNVIILLRRFCPSGADVVGQREEQTLNCNMPDTEDGVTYENQDEEAVAMIEGSPTDVGLNSNQIGTYMR